MDLEQSAGLSERGMIGAQFVLASALALVVLVLAANVLVDLYVRTAVRDAIDEGVRAAVPLGGTAQECADRARRTVQDLVRGAFADGVTLSCAVSGGQVAADATVTLPAFIGWLPGWTFRLHAAALQESPP